MSKEKQCMSTTENIIQKNIQDVLKRYPEVLYGFAPIDSSSIATQYQSALILAAPYDKQLTISNYSEAEFENSISKARDLINIIQNEIEPLLQYHKIAYYIPPAAQNNETELTAPFSFKYAAVKAGIGWIGKNDVVITETYGPRIRLSAICINYPFTYGRPFLQSKCPEDCRLCINICPYKALKGTNWNINTYRADIIDYHLCNEKRSLFLEEHGRKNACGLCMAVCPYGEKQIQ